MTSKQHLVAMALFIAANVALHLLGVTHPPAPAAPEDDAPELAPALAAEHYEPADAHLLAAAFAGDVVVCVAANTASGCA